MKLVKETYIHNKINFDSTEETILKTAMEIIGQIWSSNVHSSGAEDSYLNDLCVTINDGIKELLDNYQNEYLDTTSE